MRRLDAEAIGEPPPQAGCVVLGLMLLGLGPGMLIAACDLPMWAVGAGVPVFLWVPGIPALWLQWPTFVAVAIGLVSSRRLRSDRRVWQLIGLAVLSQAFLLHVYSQPWS